MGNEIKILMTNHDEINNFLLSKALEGDYLKEMRDDFLVSSMDVKEVHGINDNQVLFIVETEDIEQSITDLIGSYDNPILTVSYIAKTSTNNLLTGLIYEYDYRMEIPNAGESK